MKLFWYGFPESLEIYIPIMSNRTILIFTYYIDLNVFSTPPEQKY